METKRKGGIFFIINPISGKGKTRQVIPVIRSFCKKRGIRYALHETSQNGDGASLSIKGKACGFDTIVAVGGDGTINEVGKELIGSDVALGIIPRGSGNGLARHLKIPMKLRPSLRRIASGRRVLIDTGKLGEHTFLNMAGIGFDARVSKAFSEAPKRGWFSYLKIILSMSKKIDALNLTIESEKGKSTYQCIMLSVANSAQYGNNAKIAPKADIADGKADLCIVRPMGFFRAFIFFIRIMLGRVRKNKYFDTFSSQSFKIKGSGKLGHVDGDPVQIPDEIEVKMKAKSLYVIC